MTLAYGKRIIDSWLLSTCSSSPEGKDWQLDMWRQLSVDSFCNDLTVHFLQRLLTYGVISIFLWISLKTYFHQKAFL